MPHLPLPFAPAILCPSLLQVFSILPTRQNQILTSSSSLSFPSFFFNESTVSFSIICKFHFLFLLFWGSLIDLSLSQFLQVLAEFLLSGLVVASHVSCFSCIFSRPLVFGFSEKKRKENKPGSLTVLFSFF